jgi:hypothetical protein
MNKPQIQSQVRDLVCFKVQGLAWHRLELWVEIPVHRQVRVRVWGPAGIQSGNPLYEQVARQVREQLGSDIREWYGD